MVTRGRAESTADFPAIVAANIAARLMARMRKARSTCRNPREPVRMGDKNERAKRGGDTIDGSSGPP
jgi:hypothetical protein